MVPDKRFAKKQTKIWAGVVLLLLSTGFTLFLLEIATRLWLPPPYPHDDSDDVHALNYLSCDPVLGWVGTPHYQGVIKSQVFEQEVTFNAEGMYDSEHLPEKPAGTFRMLMLGDSFVQGFQVPEHETAHQVLEDIFNAAHETTQTEVLSAGAIGWGTGQQLVYYQERGRQFQPDVVLLMFFIGNDLQNNLPGNIATVDGVNCYAPYLAWCEPQLNPDPLFYVPGVSNRLANNCSNFWRSVIKIAGSLYQKSRLYQQIDPLIVAHNPRPAFGTGYLTPLYALYLPDEEELLEHAWQVTLATIAKLQQAVTADGAQLVVVIISPQEIFQFNTLAPAIQTQFFQQNPPLANVEINRPNRRLTDFFEAHNIFSIDLTDPMLAQHQTLGTPLYLEGDRHWTVVGNRIVAEIIAQELFERGLGPPEFKRLDAPVSRHTEL